MFCKFVREGAQGVNDLLELIEIQEKPSGVNHFLIRPFLKRALGVPLRATSMQVIPDRTGVSSWRPFRLVLYVEAPVYSIMFSKAIGRRSHALPADQQLCVPSCYQLPLLYHFFYFPP